MFILWGRDRRDRRDNFQKMPKNYFIVKKSIVNFSIKNLAKLSLLSLP
jgi:hypothetical protein